MSMPGFTAEVSLYKVKGHYTMKHVFTDFYHLGTVQMARKDKEGLHSCKSSCRENSTTLEGSVICDDYCDCAYDSDNSWFTCVLRVLEDLTS